MGAAVSLCGEICDCGALIRLQTLSVDPANVVQSLVHTLLDVFDATRDLYNTLRDKEKRDFEKSLRSRGYTDSRRIDYADDETASDEGIVLDKAAVTKQFDIGLNDIGPQFAIGDGTITLCAVFLGSG
jgi:hypothetical protein